MSVPTLLTVAQFCAKHPAWTKGSLRWKIFNSNKNGLDEAGAIVRDGARVLIDEQKWFDCILRRTNAA
jgi:hypothetical protein